MKVEDLIAELKKLPKDSKIGSFDIDDSAISNNVSIYGKKDTVCTSSGRITIKSIEDGRYSNLDKLCDFYIG